MAWACRGVVFPCGWILDPRSGAIRIYYGGADSCLALATAQKRPIYVTHALFEQVEDMSEVLDRINESNGGEAE